MRCHVAFFAGIFLLFPNTVVRAQFDFEKYTIGTSPRAGLGQTALADVDRDGDLDFLDGTKDGNELYWWEYNSANDWEFHAIGVDSGGGPQVGGAAVDINGDGMVDFLSTSCWFEQPSNPKSLWIKHHYNGHSGAHDVLVADLDGNGDLETIQMVDSSPQLKMLDIPADPTSPHWPEQSFGTSVHAGMAVADLDGDGDVDIVRARTWYENENGLGSSWTTHANSIPFSETNSEPADSTTTALGDIDGDGDMDIALSGHDGGTVAWVENTDGTGTSWSLHTLNTDMLGSRADEQVLHSVLLADFDNDADLDIFSAHSRGKAWIWRNSGNGEFTRFEIAVDSRGHLAKTGDVDGDGDLDIVGKPWRQDKKHVYLQNQLVENGEDWRLVFNGQDLNGWKVSSENPQGDTQRWQAVGNEILIGQDTVGNGGTLVTENDQYDDFEVEFDVWPKWGNDSGFYLRAEENSGKGLQVTIDYEQGGSVGSIYAVDGANSGFLSGQPEFTLTSNGSALTPGSSPRFFEASDWPNIWNTDNYNTFLVRIQGNPATITVWINGTKVNQVTDDQARFGGRGRFAMQVHSGNQWVAGAVNRFRNIRVRDFLKSPRN